LTYKGDHEGDREGLLDNMTIAIKQDPVWGMKIMRELAASDQEAADVWERLLWAWSDASLSEEQWKGLLSLIDTNEKILDHDLPLAKFLAQGIQKNDNPLPYPLLTLAMEIASKLWEIAAQKQNQSDISANNWLTVAINHTGGVLAKFYLQAIAYRKKHEEFRHDGIPIELRDQLDKIIRGGNVAAKMGCIVLASQLHYLFSVDPSWTTNNVIPLFDLSRNELQAIQAWHGFLVWGRWFDDLLHHLLPLYEQCFKKLDNELVDFRSSFTNHVAGICMFSSLSETRGDWLNTFVAGVSNASRAEFASSIRLLLQSIDTNRVRALWEEWLTGYWENRILGKPIPLSGDEMGEMVQWSPYLKPVYPSVVKMICRYDQELSVDGRIFLNLLEEKIPEAFPKDTSCLLRHILTNSQVSFLWKLEEIIEILIEHKETHADLRETLDILAGQGFPKAAEYIKRLEDMDGES